jgi:hypothetical protein
MVELRQDTPDENPYRTAIIDAMRYVDLAMTVIDITCIFDGEKSARFFQCHVRRLQAQGEIEIAGIYKARGVAVRLYRLAESSR